ncbi:MAG: His/Gly/Thr/Pro-type tRNA ligase C-terminal domain-containing protein, partial [Candidatus Omnitrophica bacterium]|nr:His/Gly/Thr/Pro-type tRNA ligase C-terminal domain-containing protein [Candidatus Omnitrophota bacterium]
GIIWNKELCPFEVVILPTNMDEAKIKLAAERVYEGLLKQGASVLIDDRELSAGIKFKDADLLGIPLRLIVGKKFLEGGLLELKERKTGEVVGLEEKEALEKILDKIDKLK